MRVTSCHVFIDKVPKTQANDKCDVMVPYPAVWFTFAFDPCPLF